MSQENSKQLENAEEFKEDIFQQRIKKTGIKRKFSENSNDEEQVNPKKKHKVNKHSPTINTFCNDKKINIAEICNVDPNSIEDESCYRKLSDVNFSELFYFFRANHRKSLEIVERILKINRMILLDFFKYKKIKKVQFA